MSCPVSHWWTIRLDEPFLLLHIVLKLIYFCFIHPPAIMQLFPEYAPLKYNSGVPTKFQTAFRHIFFQCMITIPEGLLFQNAGKLKALLLYTWYQPWSSEWQLLKTRLVVRIIHLVEFDAEMLDSKWSLKQNYWTENKVLTLKKRSRLLPLRQWWEDFKLNMNSHWLDSKATQLYIWKNEKEQKGALGVNEFRGQVERWYLFHEIRQLCTTSLISEYLTIDVLIIIASCHTFKIFKSNAIFKINLLV